MTQHRLFGLHSYEIPVADTHVTAPPEALRLSRQNTAILARLQRGPATRRQLADICLNVTARVSDLRAAGYRVTVDERRDGLSVYTLEGA
jgi:hypothetical protein